MPRLSCQRQMQCQKVSTAKYVVKVLEQFNLERASATGGEIRIVSNRSHAKGNRAPRDLGSNSSHPNNPDCLPMKFDTFVAFAIPMSRFHAPMCLWNAARNGD